MISHQYSASFSGVTLFGAVDPWGLFLTGQVRIDTAGLLASVTLDFAWVDTNGNQSHQVAVGLTSLGISPPFSFPVFSSGNEYLVMSGTLVGTATFTVQLGTIYL